MKWIEPDEIVVPESYQDAVGGHPLVARTLFRRGIKDKNTALAFLNPDLYQPSQPEILPGIETAVDIIDNAIKTGQTICVWGDFDVDGQTATTILVSALQKLGAHVIFHIPNRDKESHGVNIPFLNQLLEQKLDILLTCDTGISAHDAVIFAKQKNIITIITDHHDLPEILPEADVIVDPKMLDASHPLHPLSGAAIAYKLVEALFELHHIRDECEIFLDLVALSLIADVAPLYGDARYLAQTGLEKLRNTTRKGLKELMVLAGIDPASITEEHIGFEIAPRLNALGRLSDATPIVEFFTTENIERARILSNQLDGLNNQRKLITEQIYQAALSQIEREPTLLDNSAVVLSHASWHPGIIGLVASRLVEQFNKPAVLICTPKDEMARGSARSIEGVDISSAIRQNQQFLSGFGGHPMAAGLSMPAENIPSFRISLSKTIEEMVDLKTLQPCIMIDDYLQLSEISLQFAEDVERLAPFGSGNPALSFATKNLTIKNQKYIGQAEKHLLLTVEDKKGNQQNVIWWRGAGETIPQQTFNLAYRLQSTTYLGKKEVSVIWLDAQPVLESACPIEKTRSLVEMIDYRNTAHPLETLQEILQNNDDIQIWAEADARMNQIAKSRLELEPCKKLIIWTAPPSYNIFSDVLHISGANKIYLFSIQPEIIDQGQFLKRLAGHIKYSLAKLDGVIFFPRLAAATAQRINTVCLGINWLEESGFIQIITQDSETIKIKPGNGNKHDQLSLVTAKLDTMMMESAAFRSYFTKASIDQLVKNIPGHEDDQPVIKR